MEIDPIFTDKILPNTITLEQFIDRYVTNFKNCEMLVMTSKIVSIIEGSVVRIGDIEKELLINNEADLTLQNKNQYNIPLTIKNGIIIPSAGIDESNGHNYYVLWPKAPQLSANKIREHLISKFKIKFAGVIITDSKTTPLRWGTTGISLAHSGFKALNNYIGKPDIFGKTMHATKANVADGLAAAAVVAMGEGSEQTPIATISNTNFVQFSDRSPSAKELEEMKIDINDDLYAPLIQNAHWKKCK